MCLELGKHPSKKPLPNRSDVCAIVVIAVLMNQGVVVAGLETCDLPCRTRSDSGVEESYAVF